VFSYLHACCGEDVMNRILIAIALLFTSMTQASSMNLEMCLKIDEYYNNYREKNKRFSFNTEEAKIYASCLLIGSLGYIESPKVAADSTSVCFFMKCVAGTTTKDCLRKQEIAEVLSSLAYLKRKHKCPTS